MARLPPITRLALAFAVGAAWVPAGAPIGWAPLLAVLVLASPIGASARPARPIWLAVAAAGLLSGLPGARAAPCLGAPDQPADLQGVFLAAPRAGSGPFRPSGGCEPLTVVLASTAAPAGLPLRVVGTWRQGRHRPWLQADRVIPTSEGTGARRSVALATIRWRDGLVARLGRLYGDRAPLVSALTLARREGLEPQLRDGFAKAGIAHLLAISGFHVGVLAGLVVVLLRAAGATGRLAGLGAAAASWCYVAFIGFPDAACRAALILALVSASRAGARPPARWGALGAALLILLALDPGRVSSPGFQLSFAGAGGLVAWSGPVRRRLDSACRGRCPDGLLSAIAVGVAATLATLPVVAWHFGRVSMVGVPVTLAATPLVVLALVGALASLLVDFVSHSVASFLAGGVSVVVALLEKGTTVVGSWAWASAWTTRPTVIAGLAGLAMAFRAGSHPRVGAQARRLLVASYVGAAVVAWPGVLAWQNRGTVEVMMIDVGQGDAIALRGPGGRWALVDTGPAGTSADPAAHPVVRALRARGVRALDALVLTHPDLDHIGGARAVLSELDVAAVYDPGVAAGRLPFVQVLEAARAAGVPWVAARAGDHIRAAGLEMAVLHPGPDVAGAESNATSVVLLLRHGDFDALLTGDAYRDVERALAPAIGPGLEVLKVGHHGSETSTDPLLIATTRPEIALVSAGRRNRYGHPAPSVLERLEDGGVRVHRTDLEGSVSVVGRSDGTYTVEGGR